jgi:hypothetical protein
MIRCYTLIDITATGFTRKPKTPEDIVLRNQQRNYETFQQLISLRSQPTIERPPVQLQDVHIDDHTFGNYYMPSLFPYTIWMFNFYSEQLGAYANDSSAVGSLIEDFNDVPIIDNLSETAKINNTINTLGDHANTYFRVI